MVCKNERKNYNAKARKTGATWVGKYDEKKIEPRILVEDKSKSYGDPNSENMLIHGDNLIALQALQQDYVGKVKCIYIAPPYNTGSRINADGEDVGYDDDLEHSIWLSKMKDTPITSANLSYHGQEGNIELGTLIESSQIAKQVKDIFTQLMFKKIFVEVKD